MARTGSRELFTLGVLTVAIGIAFGAAALFSVSALWRLGAGVVLSESELSHKAAANALPLQDAFAVLFFVSVGMLFDPAIVWRAPWTVGRAAAHSGRQIAGGPGDRDPDGLSAQHRPVHRRVTGADRGVLLHPRGTRHQVRLLPLEGQYDPGGALLSITLHPLVFGGAERVMAGVRTWPWLARRFEEQRRALGRRARRLEAARAQAERKAAAHKTFTPQSSPSASASPA